MSRIKEGAENEDKVYNRPLDYIKPCVYDTGGTQREERERHRKIFERYNWRPNVGKGKEASQKARKSQAKNEPKKEHAIVIKLTKLRRQIYISDKHIHIYIDIYIYI